MSESIWQIEQHIIDLLHLDTPAGTPLFIGKSNYQHMMDTHPDDFKKYGTKILEILKDPDFVSVHPTDGSIQYIKVYHDQATDEHVLVAARATKKDSFFIRSMFVMSKEKKVSYEKKGYLKAVTRVADVTTGHTAS